VASDDSVYVALELMAEHNIGAVLVLEDGRPTGILSERDYARKIVLDDRASRDTPARDIMTADPICVRGEQTIDECMALMTAKRFRHLPVVRDDQVVGMLSIGDVVKAIISEREFVIQQLENYISGQ
jgi:IMP dehydrogenase